MHTEDFRERIWAEIDLDALCYNFTQIKGLLKPQTRVLAVVKANAYGHGAVKCAQTLLEAGADYLGVATIDEAMELRNADIGAPILILGHTAEREAENLILHNITPTVYTKAFAEALSETAVRMGKQIPIHIKVNTGMERIGFGTDETETILSVCRLPGLVIEGLFTHLACADEAASSGVHRQYERFMAVVEALEAAGISIPIRHILNSAGVFEFPQYQLEMVRLGIVLYGYYSSTLIHRERAALKPVMTKSPFTTMGRFTSIPSVASSFSCSSSVMVGSFSFKFMDLYSRPLVLKNFFSGRPLI